MSRQSAPASCPPARTQLDPRTARVHRQILDLGPVEVARSQYPVAYFLAALRNVTPTTPTNKPATLVTIVLMKSGVSMGLCLIAMIM
jgi:hypothetical protein